MNLTLRDYQTDISVKACDLLKQYKIAYLSMQVRTGKTLTALQCANLYGAKNVLFLTKKKAKESIVSDYDKLKPDFTLTVENYEQVHNLTPVYDLVILDESHSLGQFPKPAKKIKFIKDICKDIPIIYLSGTPTPESFSQIYHQFHVSSFSPFQDASFYKWAAHYVTIGKKYFFNRAVNDYSKADKEKIDQVTKHLFISYTQAEAGFESFVNEQIIKVNMHPFTYSAISKLKKDRVYISNSGIEILADTEVKLMSKMHQMFSGSVIDEKGQSIPFDDSKVKFIKKHFAKKKIAIFYKFKGEELLIKKHFQNTTDSPEEFNSSTDKVFISQIQSGREGTNLSTADCLIMLNIDYSYLSYEQGRARVQTKDRTKESTVYWIFSNGGIEEMIYKRVINKSDYTLAYFRKDFGVNKIDKVA